MIITEPSRGKNILLLINNWASSDVTLFHVISILADIFVFIYPILLIGLFILGFQKKRQEYQYGAISIFISTLTATVINILIQLFIQKDRPETLSGLQLILKHVPSVSFPSDHATVSMSFAMGFLLIISNSIKLSYGKTIAYLLFGCSIIMGLCRVAVAVHRPTDIIAGWIIGIIGGWLGYTITQSVIGEKISARVIEIIDAILFRIQTIFVKR